MNTTYLVAGGSGLITALMIVAALLWPRKSANPQATKREGGLAVNQRVIKDQKLSSEFILSAIEDGVVIVGRDNVIHMFNPAASKISGWPSEEAVGLDFHSVLTLVNERGEAYVPEVHPFAKALNTNTTIRDSKGWLATRGGKHIPVSLIVSPVTEENQTADSVVGVFRDITAERLEEDRRSEFISTASHEMRTPIAAIEGYLALALNDKVSNIDKQARSYLEKAHIATKQLGQLFQDLLTSSKAEDGRLASYPTVIEIGEIVQQVADAGRFNARQKNLDLKYIVSSTNQVAGSKVVRPLFYSFADPNRIREVLQNIIDNAVKYTGEGSVTIVLTGDSSVIQIQVQDTGPGIPEEDIPHLFQKFYRVDNSMTRSIGGTGLGLFICRKIIELYNGRIWAESSLGKGSSFFINLPRLTTEQALDMQRKKSSTIAPLERL